MIKNGEMKLNLGVLKNKAVLVGVALLISSTLNADFFDDMKKKRQQATESEQQDITQKVKGNSIRTYFNNMKIIVPKYDKTDISFAGLGSNMNYYESVQAMCNIKSLTKIWDRDKSIHCVKNAREADMIEEPPSKFFEMKTFETKYLRNVLDTYKINGTTVELLSINSSGLTVNADTITLQGVKFQVVFEYKSIGNINMLKGLIDDSKRKFEVVETKVKGNKRTYLAFLILDNIKLIPYNEQNYVTQVDKIIEMYKGKYPDIKSERDYSSYSHNRNKVIINTNRRNLFIEYTFYSGDFGKYAQSYIDKKSNELSKSSKNDAGII